MKKTICIAIAAALSMVATSAIADDQLNSISIGSYSNTFEHSAGSNTITYSGVSATYTRSMMRNKDLDIGMSLNFHGGSYKPSGAEYLLTGFDGALAIGRFNRPGWEYIASFGLYSETITDKTIYINRKADPDVNASGGFVGLSGGYNWKKMKLSVETRVRSAKDYADASGASDLSSAAFSVSLGSNF